MEAQQHVSKRPACAKKPPYHSEVGAPGRRECDKMSICHVRTRHNDDGQPCRWGAPAGLVQGQVAGRGSGSRGDEERVGPETPCARSTGAAGDSRRRRKAACRPRAASSVYAIRGFGCAAGPSVQASGVATATPGARRRAGWRARPVRATGGRQRGLARVRTRRGSSATRQGGCLRRSRSGTPPAETSSDENDRVESFGFPVLGTTATPIDDAESRAGGILFRVTRLCYATRGARLK